MHILLVSLLISVVSIGAYAEAQFYPSVHGDNYFRANLPQPSHDIPALLKNEPRFFFTTLSVTLATVTVQSTTTTTTSCTTSTAALIQCTNSGRRRRGLSFDNGAGLYYSEDGQDESPFLPNIQKYINSYHFIFSYWVNLTKKKPFERFCPLSCLCI